MSTTPQKRALSRYRKRLNQRGMARFEVLGLGADRELIRSLAKRLAANGPDSLRIRASVRLTISGEQPKKGGRRGPGSAPPGRDWAQGRPMSRSLLDTNIIRLVAQALCLPRCHSWQRRRAALASTGSSLC